MSSTESADMISPMARASLRGTAPDGMGRVEVRTITSSISASYHMLIAPDAPAPTAMQNTATAPRIG